MHIKRSASAKPFPPRDSVEPAIKVCPPDQLQEWVEELAEPRHFVAQPEANRRAAGWIGRCLEFWGYRVTYQGPWRNVVALPAGGNGPWTLVCSHYDTVATTPGADDNASAVAVMLGCALALSRFSPRPAVGFVSFNREEDGLLGSADFVENAGIKVSKAHVLEMVGYASHERGSQTVPQGLPIKMPDAGDFLGLLANRDSGPLLDHVLRSARTHVPDFPVLGLQVWLGLERHFPVLLRSDHAPFWKARIPALMWTDTSEFRNPNYHRDSDTPATLDYRFMATVTELLVHTLIADALND